MQTVSAAPKGVVHPHLASQRFRLARYQPEGRLKEVLDHFWIVEWDLRNQPPFTQRTLPYPCVNLVFDHGKTALFGVVSGAFDYTLQGQGKVLGLRFRPGGFYPLLRRPLRDMTDQVLALETLFEVDSAALETQILQHTDDASMIALAERFLLPYLPPADPVVDTINGWLQMVQDQTEITRVEQWAEQAGLAKRTLQQLFADYVGVSPKWVLARYRLHDLAHQLATGQQTDLAALAVHLGYFDQAHLSKDFKKFIGQSPAAYYADQERRRHDHHQHATQAATPTEGR